MRRESAQGRRVRGRRALVCRCAGARRETAAYRGVGRQRKARRARAGERRRQGAVGRRAPVGCSQARRNKVRREVRRSARAWLASSKARVEEGPATAVPNWRMLRMRAAMLTGRARQVTTRQAMEPTVPSPRVGEDGCRPSHGRCLNGSGSSVLRCELDSVTVPLSETFE